MNEVGHFGVHWSEGDIAFLLQGDRSDNALGIAIEAPFRIDRKRCNHQIPLMIEPAEPHLEAFERLRTDPLVQAMCPAPRADDRAVFLAGGGHDDKVLLSLLSKLSSPIRPIIQPFWMLKPSQIIDELMSTNVQPLVLTDIEPTSKPSLDKVLQAVTFAPRQLVLFGSVSVILRPEVRRIETGLRDCNLADLVSLPWEALGGWLLKQHMLKRL